VLELLRAQLGEALHSAEQVGEELRVRIPATSLVEVARLCKEQGYHYPCDITAVDTRSELLLIYRFLSTQTGQHLVISLPLPRSGGRAPTLSRVYGAAVWLEREVYDLFGIRFDGHPDMTRILLDDDWQGHPLLK
jgi:NADH-quinone oxidoreductase subunit C